MYGNGRSILQIAQCHFVGGLGMPGVFEMQISLLPDIHIMIAAEATHELKYRIRIIVDYFDGLFFIEEVYIRHVQLLLIRRQARRLTSSRP
ncbi:hypothetical protein D3C76_930110 [compost metagenome]